MSLNTRDDHLDFLTYLETVASDGSFCPAIPKMEGAFYFGNSCDLAEYIIKYREQCIKEGWMDES